MQVFKRLSVGDKFKVVWLMIIGLIVFPIWGYITFVLLGAIVFTFQSLGFSLHALVSSFFIGVIALLFAAGAVAPFVNIYHILRDPL